MTKKGEHKQRREAVVKRGVASETQKRIVAIVGAAPDGISTADVAAVLTLSHSRVQEHLMMMRRMGVLVSVSRGARSRWATVANAERVRALVLKQSIDNLISRGYVKAAEQLRIAGKFPERPNKRRRREAIEEEDQRPFVHRIVPAHECPPIKIKSPVWVFGYGI